ncbi:MAG: flagellar basal body L-ring protein FlgH [Usitatibacteraceae bacterium]
MSNKKNLSAEREQNLPSRSPKVVAVLLLMCTACSHIEPRVSIVEPTSARPTQASAVAVNNGAIFQNALHRPLFEDPRARLRGDIITIAINEKNSASRTSSSTTSKSNDVKAAVPAIGNLSAAALKNLNLTANSSNSFSGKGDTANENAFTGTITVTVVNVLPNGNLVVAGEKQIGINHNLEFIRFSGVVNPVTLQAGNIVDSTKVADARLEYTGKGYIDEAQRMGWMSRFFLTFLPF